MLVEKIVQSTRSSDLKFARLLLGGMTATLILATLCPVEAASTISAGVLAGA